MKQNMGELERILRVVLGIYAMLLGFLFLQGVIGMMLGILGAISTVTGLVGYCGIYALLGREYEPEPAEPVNAQDAEVDDAD